MSVLKSAFAAILIVLLGACATLSGGGNARRMPSSGQNSLLRSTLPVSGEPLFLGVSNRMAEREEELAACILDAATRAAIYRFTEVSGVFLREKKGSGIGYAGDFDLSFDRSLIPAEMDRLKVHSFYRSDEGSYLLARLEGESYPRLSYSPGLAGTPGWLQTPPEIPGFYTGIGVVQRSRSIASSLEKADAAALEDIAAQIHLRVTTSLSNTSGNGGSGTATLSKIEARASVRGFVVISRWRDDDYYYSLGVAPRSLQEPEG